MSVLVRASLRQVATRRAVVQKRFMSAEHKYEHIPFDYNKKGVFATKLGLFLISGFSIPFAAAVYQLRKSGNA